MEVSCLSFKFPHICMRFRASLESKFSDFDSDFLVLILEAAEVEVHNLQLKLNEVDQILKVHILGISSVPHFHIFMAS